MRFRKDFTASSFMVAAVINSVICMVIGGLLDGLRGGQIGLLAGIVVTVLPFASRTVAVSLSRPDNLARWLARRIGAVVVEAAASFADALGWLFAPLAGTLRRPAGLVAFAAAWTGQAVARTLKRAARIVGTPLGVANLGALLVIACNLAHLDFGPFALFVGFGAMILVLLTDANETAD